MEKLILIDGNSLINRAFYAMPLLSTKDGIYTNAVYGFLNMFFKMLSEEKPDYVGVAFDLKAPTFRHKMYGEYKGTRKPMPFELRPQIPLLKELLTLMGVKTFELEGYEADDIIGTIAKNTDIPTLIYTGDKDSFQLVDEQTEVHFTRRGITDVEIYNNANFTEKMGINPLQIIDLKGLMGDSSDNIPGVPGVGEKTALTLIQTYGSVENLYNHTDELKGKLKEKIENGKEFAILSKTLATINVNSPIPFSTEEMRVSLPLKSQVKERFINLEFKSLYSKSELFDENPKNIETPEEKATLIVKDSLKEASSLVKKGSAICIFNDAFNISDGKEEYSFKINKTLLDDGFNLSDILSEFKPIFTGETPILVFDKKELKHLLYSTLNITLTCPCDDLSLVKYLADYSGGAVKLSDVITEYGKDEKLPATAIYQVYQSLYQKLCVEEMEELYKKVELPLSDVLFSMEQSGFKIDANALNLAGKKYAETLAELERQIRELANDLTLNVNSPKQLGELLFEKLKVGKGKKTKTGYSTSADELEKLESSHPIIPLILKHRKLQKLTSTYVEGFKPLIEKETGLIHTSFNQTVTSTGRLSSKEPNLQNIPVRDDEGKELRKFFVPRDEEHILIGADYSQIELRLLAAFSGCPALVKAFKDGKDIHSETASKVFKTPIEKVTKQMRSASKAVNFGIIYGISEYGLAKNLKISPAEAREYINSYFLEYPEVKQYMTDNVEFAKKTGYAITYLKRRRYIREINASNFALRSFGERAAMNMPLQGSSADVIKLAMLGVYNRLKDENLQSKLILQVHDELIIDALISEKERVEKILKEEMENAVSLSVPLTVETGSGKTWYDAK